jgi:hypothetical protein
MEWRDMMVDSYGRVYEGLAEALRGLTREDLDWLPKPDCNGMGWLAWHLARVEDAQIADLANVGQVWIVGSWFKKFGRKQDMDDTGFGDTPEQVAAFRSPSAKTIIGYYEDVAAQSRKYISGLAAMELDRQLDEKWFNPVPTVGVRLVSIVNDVHQHLGQVAYVRGLLKGKGCSGI